MKAFVVAICLTLFSVLSANSLVGSVENFEGNVKVKSDGSIKKSKVSVGLEIREGDLITTSKKAMAQLKLVDGSVLVLDEKSSISFTTVSDAQQHDGKVFYKITSRNAKNSLKIKTPFAIIGIKGTTFIVNATKDASITLKEGLIGVSSVKEQFELYRQKVQTEFTDYKSKQEEEYEKYLNAQNGYGDVEKTKEFDLKEKHRVSFLGARVNEDAWTAKDDAEFAHFEKLINTIK